jgi:hypothetical protein
MPNPKNPFPISQSKGSQAKAIAQMHNQKTIPNKPIKGFTNQG